MKLYRLLVVCGPTATGKTALAKMIARELNGEIVSADSRQVYRGMDIGTGKDLETKTLSDTLSCRVYRNAKEAIHIPYIDNGIPVWLYDVVRPDEDFSISQYRLITRQVLKNIWNRGKLPILTGGTGLYIREIVAPSETIGIPRDRIFRMRTEKLSLQTLQCMIGAEAPGVWKELNPSDRANPRRLIRKLEIFRWQALHPHDPETNKADADWLRRMKTCDICYLGLCSGNSRLYARIDDRVEERMRRGLLDEVKILLSRGYTFAMPSMSALGYREWQGYFGTSDEKLRAGLIPQIIRQWKFDEHAYARRQMTWFRKIPSIRWFDVSDSTDSQTAVRTAKEWYNINKYEIKDRNIP